MQAAEGRRARVAAMSTASALGLAVDDAVVLSDSNRLVLRLMPCDVVARIAPVGYRVFSSAGGHSEKLKSFNGSRRPTGRWLFWNLESSHESSCETASKSPCGPTSNRCSIKTFHRMTTRTQWRVFITPCASA